MLPQQVEIQSWHNVLAALEASNVTDAQIKGHLAVRHFSEADDEDKGHFSVSAKAGVSMFYKYPSPSVGVLFLHEFH